MSERRAGTTIIVACRNEEELIGDCLEQLARVLPEAEILVVHGGQDRTYDIAADFARSHPNVIPIRHLDDRGKGHAVKTGIARATNDIMAQFDADLQFRAEDLPVLVAPVQRGECDVCLGSRFLGGSDRSAYRPVASRDLGNRVLSAFVSLLIGRRATDVTSGMKAWTRAAIRHIDFRDDAYSYEAEIIIRAARLGLRLAEVPVQYASRTAGESMHRNSLALARAGLAIMGKALAARFRSA